MLELKVLFSLLKDLIILFRGNFVLIPLKNDRCELILLIESFKNSFIFCLFLFK